MTSTTTAAPARADLRGAALGYAAAGIPVFPCAPGGKTPLTRTGFHAASTDPDLITAWWRRRPDANIATPTGAPGFDVLDVDVRADGTGWPAYTAAERAGLLHGWLRAVRTPSGGLHLHYPGTEQRNATLPGRHLDFRGVGGYVLLPPSIGHPDTGSRPYLLHAHQPGAGRPLPWAAITALLTPSATPPRQPPRRRDGVDPTGWLAGHVARQREGNRDNALFWAACRAAEAGITDLQPLIDAAITAGLPQPQAARTVASARTTITRTGARPRPTGPGPPLEPAPTR